MSIKVSDKELEQVDKILDSILGIKSGILGEDYSNEHREHKPTSTPERVINVEDNRVIENLTSELKVLKDLIVEVHSVNTGKLYQPKKRLTKKQKEQLEKEKEEAEIAEIRRTAHLRIINNG